MIELILTILLTFLFCYVITKYVIIPLIMFYIFKTAIKELVNAKS